MLWDSNARYISNYNLVGNSFKIGDTILLQDFNIGTTSEINFSGQYTVDSIGASSSYIYLNVNNNTTLINYGASSSNIVSGGFPLPFNATSSYSYLLSNRPYLDLNKGVKYRITRISDLDSSSVEERYLVEKLNY